MNGKRCCSLRSKRPENEYVSLALRIPHRSHVYVVQTRDKFDDACATRILRDWDRAKQHYL